MSDEIKEILDGFKEILDNPTTTDECYDGRIIEIDRSYDLDLDEIKLLLDYITNLQQENERFKKLEYKFFYCSEDEESFTLEDYLELGNKVYDLEQENERLKNDIEDISCSHFSLFKKYEDYKSRVEKAIEYITSYEAISAIQGLDKIEQNKKLDERTMNVMVERYLKVHHNLLNILQEGKDNNNLPTE